MVSDIVKYYLQSRFRQRLLGEIVDEEEEEYGDDDERFQTTIYIEMAEIQAERPEDDEAIIEFLSRLGDVEVDVVIDDYSLKFEPGTFDNWISREEFRRKCEEWKEVYKFEDYVTANYCYYDLTEERISSSPPESGIYILFNVFNVVFEIQGGLQFPRVFTGMVPDTREFEKCFRKMRKDGILRHPLTPEVPIYMDHLDTVESRTTRFPRLVVNARYDGGEIDIVQPIDDKWLTRTEVLDYVKAKIAKKKYVKTIEGAYNSAHLLDIDISNIGCIGIARSKDEIYLHVGAVKTAEEILPGVYRDYP